MFGVIKLNEILAVIGVNILVLIIILFMVRFMKIRYNMGQALYYIISWYHVKFFVKGINNGDFDMLQKVVFNSFIWYFISGVFLIRLLTSWIDRKCKKATRIIIEENANKYAIDKRRIWINSGMFMPFVCDAYPSGTYMSVKKGDKEVLRLRGYYIGEHNEKYLTENQCETIIYAYGIHCLAVIQHYKADEVVR